MKNIEYLIWDFDGTLFNTYPSIASIIVKLIKRIYKKDLIFNKIKDLCQVSLYFCFDQISKDLNID